MDSIEYTVRIDKHLDGDILLSCHCAQDPTRDMYAKCERDGLDLPLDNMGIVIRRHFNKILKEKLYGQGQQAKADANQLAGIRLKLGIGLWQDNFSRMEAKEEKIEN